MQSTSNRWSPPVPVTSPPPVGINAWKPARWLFSALPSRLLPPTSWANPLFCSVWKDRWRALSAARTHRRWAPAAAKATWWTISGASRPTLLAPPIRSSPSFSPPTSMVLAHPLKCNGVYHFFLDYFFWLLLIFNLILITLICTVSRVWSSKSEVWSIIYSVIRILFWSDEH